MTTARALAPPLMLVVLACSGAQHRGPSGGPSNSSARAPYTAAQLASVVDINEVEIAPDGREIAFVTDRSGSNELWTVALDASGQAGEPVQRTHANQNVAGLSWAPDGSMLVFDMDYGGNELHDLWLLRRGGDPPEQLTHSDANSEQNARFSPDGRWLAFERDSDRPFRFNIHVMNLATHVVRQLTHESINVLSPRWSRDGRTLYVTRSGDDQHGDVLVIDVASGSQRVVASPRADGIVWIRGNLPDGSVLTSATNADGFMQLATWRPDGAAFTFVGPGDWDVERVDVAVDGTVVMARNVHGESEISVASAPDWAHPRVIAHGGIVTALSIADRGTAIAIGREASNHPPEIVALDAVRQGETMVVQPRAGDVRIDQLTHAVRHTIRSFDGRGIDAFVWQPPVPRLGTPPPLLVHVHGGPNGQTRGAFSQTIQALAEAGFEVASVNYRGSVGYGRAFEDLNNRDWGGGDLRDILAAVSALGAAHEVDRSRVGIFGGSYGGYMTLRAITAAPEVWRAAVEMYGMPDLEEDVRITGDRFGSWYVTEMGDPVRGAALYRERSPIHAMNRVRAPLLVLQGANDNNVPRRESDEVVAALHARRQPVEYQVYANEGHGFTHRENRVDSTTRAVAFFSHWLALRR